MIKNQVSGNGNAVCRKPSLDLGLYQPRPGSLNPTGSTPSFARSDSPWMPPIMRMPVEMLVEIFNLSASQCPGGHHLGRKPAIPKLLNIARVCKDWQNIVFAASYLWAYIPLTISEKKLGAEQLSVLESFFERSRSCPLTIDVTIQVPAHVHLMPLLEILRRYADRWEDVALTLPPYTIACMLSSLQLPLLRRLYLRTPSLPPDEPLFHIPRVVINAPKLLSVTFDMDTVPTASQFGIPWGQLKACHGISGTVSELLTVLRQLALTNVLERCSLVYSDEHVMIGISSPLPSHEAPITTPKQTHQLNDRVCLPSLQSLIVSIDGNDSRMVNFLRALCFPNLRTLTIQCLDYPDPELDLFLKRTTSIIGLTLEDSVSAQNVLAHALNVLPYLSYVAIRGNLCPGAVEFVLQQKVAGACNSLHALRVEHYDILSFQKALSLYRNLPWTVDYGCGSATLSFIMV